LDYCKHIASFVLLVFGLSAATPQPDAAQIVKRSIAANEQTWKEAPNWSFKERDAQPKDGGVVSKTYQVLMIEGSQYNKRIAENDMPLSPEETAKEEEKLKREIHKRRSESPAERAKRIGKYQREREQDHAMMREMTDAFEFRLLGTENVRGRLAYVLEATPKAGYVPKNRDAKVLTGMEGKLYVDETTYQWARVHVEVIHPVSFYGFLAKVEPGTRIDLEQAPVADGLWFPIRFSQEVKATALGIINENKTEEETYSEYCPMGKALR
jgi:hypothetical protein